MGYIYMLTSPSGKTYIGQTYRPIEERFKDHQKPSSRCMAISNAIQKYGWENFEKDWYECPDEDLNKHEELMIEILGTLAPEGYNLKEGGSNGKMSEETKRKMSEAQQGDNHPMFGKNHTEETKQKMSDSHSGKKFSDIHKQKIGEAQKGEKHHFYGKKISDETREKMSQAHSGENNHMYGKTGEKHPGSKIVYQYDLDNNFIRSFDACQDAVRYLKKKTGTHISMCACGERKTAYGFKWSYIKY